MCLEPDGMSTYQQRKSPCSASCLGDISATFQYLIFGCPKSAGCQHLITIGAAASQLELYDGGTNISFIMWSLLHHTKSWTPNFYPMEKGRCYKCIKP